MTLILALIATAPAGDAAIAWDGACTASQIGATGETRIEKRWNGSSYDVTLAGHLDIDSTTYGYVRHALPTGLRPVEAVSCTLQHNETCGDTNDRANYDYLGVTVVPDDKSGYEAGALWFPEKFCNGGYDLVCSWRTEEEGAVEPTCGGIDVRAQPALTISGSCPGAATVHVSGLPPESAIRIGTGQAGNTLVEPCFAQPIPLSDPVYRHRGWADSSGESIWDVDLRAEHCGESAVVVSQNSCLMSDPVAVP